MRRFFVPLLLLLLTILPARSASPTFGQVMWTNDLAKVLLSPERSTNRIQLGTNLVTFGGVSSSFPAFWREGTTINARLADNSAFAPLTAGQIRSRTSGMLLDTEDSATIFAYSFLFRKKGNAGGTNNAISAETEFGNLQWQGWDGSAFVTAAGWLPKAEQAWVAGVSTGARMELRLTASNTVGFVEAGRFTMATHTNTMLLFNGTGGDSPALQRFGRILRIRSADNTGFADLAVSNITEIRGVSYVYPGSQGANGSVQTNNGSGGLGWWVPVGLISGGTTNQYTTNISGTPVLGNFWFQGTNWSTASAVTNGPRVAMEYIPYFRSLRVGELSTGVGSNYWDPTNIGPLSIAFGSNNMAGGFASSVLGGSQNVVDTNSPWSIISGGRSNWIESATNGGMFIGGGQSNHIAGNTVGSNSIIVGGRENIIEAGSSLVTIGGGYQNRISSVASAANGAVIAGGYQNVNKSTYGFMGAGIGNTLGSSSADAAATVAGQNNVNNGADYGFIGAGLNNLLSGSGQYAVIVGGQGNGNNSANGFVGGGIGNDIAAGQAVSILGGVSNAIIEAGIDLSTIIGNWGTNRTAKSILLSPVGKIQGSNELHITANSTTNIGPLFVRAGWSSGYARVYGIMTNDVSVRTNHAGTGGFTNLSTYIVPALALSNTSDTVIFYLRGNFQFARATTNDFKAIYGTATVFDTGFVTASNCTWEATIEVTRTGNSSQIIGSKVNWIVNGAAGAGNNGALSIWATNSVNAENNGITNIFAFQAASRTASTITNDLFKVTWQGYPNF